MVGDVDPDLQACQHADLVVFVGLTWRFAATRLRHLRAAGMDRPVIVGLAEVSADADTGDLEPVTLAARPFLEEAVQTALLSTGSNSRLQLTDCEVDLVRRVVLRGGETLALTALEARLLAWLAARQGRDIARQDLLSGVWGYQRDVQTRAVDMAISRLRKKIERDPTNPDHVRACRGDGYRFVAAGPVRTPLLAAPTTSFLGRVEDLRALDQLWASGRRLLALFGPPGVGKSRLAREHLRGVSGGIWCDLEHVHDGHALLGALGAALGSSALGLSADELQRAIGEALASNRVELLVLDPVEHLLEGLIPVVTGLLARAPRLKILLGSRVRPGLPAEVVYELHPLRLDDACALFRDRARATGWTGALEQQDGSLVALLELLDRLPLAIELAAARARALSPADLRARLHGCLDLLSEGSGHGEPRQTSVRGALAWSWGLLDPDARDTLAELSVFPDSFTLDASEQVLSPRRAPVAQTLSELVDHSLVQRVVEDGRYRLLWSVRAYAAEAGAPALLAQTRARHAAWAAALARRSLRALRGEGAVRAQRLLEREQAHLYAAWEHLRSEPAQAELDEALVEVALALDAVWSSVGSLDQRLALADATLTHLPASGSGRGRLLMIRARALFALSRVAEAEADLIQACAHFRAAGNREGACNALHRRAGNLRRRGRYDEAQRLVDELRVEAGDVPMLVALADGEEGLLTALRMADRPTAALAGRRLRGVARMAVAAGDLTFGVAAWQNAITAFDIAEEPAMALAASDQIASLIATQPTQEARQTWALQRSRLQVRLGRYAEAVEGAEEVLRQMQAAGRRWAAGVIVVVLCLALQGVGRNAEALTRLELALAEARLSGAFRRAHLVQVSIVQLLLEEGRIDEAREAIDDALESMRVHPVPHAQAPLDVLQGVVLLIDGRFQEALQVLQGMPSLSTQRELTASCALLRLAAARALGRDDLEARALLEEQIGASPFAGQQALRGVLGAFDQQDADGLAPYLLPPAPPTLRVTVARLRAVVVGAQQAQQMSSQRKVSG